MIRKKFPLLLILIFFGVGLQSCHKKISSPTDHTSLLFGNWKWIYSKSDYGSITQTPNSVGYEREVEYSRKGIYKEYIDGKKEERLLFVFIEGTTVNFEQPDYVIKYYKSGLNKQEKFIDNFSVHNSDTLILKRDCSGCYSHYFIRQ